MSLISLAVRRNESTVRAGSTVGGSIMPEARHFSLRYNPASFHLLFYHVPTCKLGLSENSEDLVGIRSSRKWGLHALPHPWTTPECVHVRM